MTGIESSTWYELKPGGGGRMTLELNGSLSVDSTARVWRELDQELRQSQPATLDVDAAGGEHCDGSGLAMLHFLTFGGMTPPGAKLSVRGLRPEYAGLIQRFTAEDFQKAYSRRLPVHQNTTVALVAGWNQALCKNMNEFSSDLKAISKPAGNGLTP